MFKSKVLFAPHPTKALQIEVHNLISLGTGKKMQPAPGYKHN